jgi:hypothetical protein
VEVRAEFLSTAGPGDKPVLLGDVPLNMLAPPGEMSLYYGDVPVGSGVIPRTTPLTHGLASFTVGYQPGGGAGIDPALSGPAELPATLLGRVIIDAAPGGKHDPAAEANIDIAMQ